MKFKGKAIPAPSEGLVITELDQTVPDQSMSLREILERFTKGEALPVGKAAEWGNGQDPEGDSPLNIDLEKAANWDLVERQEFNEKVDEMKREVERVNKTRAEKAAEKKAEKEKADFEKRVADEVEKRQKNPGNPGSI